jgi:membrane protease YdiL (CAAX protease family)
LGILTGTIGYLVYNYRSDHEDADWTFSGDDLLFSGGLAYNAGFTEEAVFRGWLLPVAYQYTGQRWWLANGLQAAFFGLAHYDKKNNPVPWPQTLLGYYFGYLTRKNGWSLSEAIFVHTWWDAVLFLGQSLTTHRVEGTARFNLAFPVPL